MRGREAELAFVDTWLDPRVRDHADRAARRPTRSLAAPAGGRCATRYDKRGYVSLGTVPAASLVVRLRSDRSTT